jgi:D-alanine-D-alanine ligase
MILEKFNEVEFKHLSTFFTTHKKLVLNPLANGSSVGLFIVASPSELQIAYDKITQNQQGTYLVEPFIVGREITVGVWNRKDSTTIALPCSEIKVIQGRNFDYEGKYLGHGVEELTPAPLSENEKTMCQDLALKVHEIVKCKGYSRTDMILVSQGPMLLEINTLPGLSKASFIPQQLVAYGENLRHFFQEQIDIA